MALRIARAKRSNPQALSQQKEGSGRRKQIKPCSHGIICWTYSLAVKDIKNIDMKLTREEKYMKEALRQAKKAAAIGEVPIGCVIVMGDTIIGRGYNRRMTDKTALAHAEIIAIRKACKKVGDWRLDDAVMYVTLEPCQMCSGAIIQSRIRRLYIGAMNPKAGCAGSILDMFSVKEFNHHVEVTEGLLAEESAAMLKDFFHQLRKK